MIPLLSFLSPDRLLILLVIPLLAYVGFAATGADFGSSRFDIALPSGGVWPLTLGDILLAVALGLLFFEILTAYAHYAAMF